METAACGPPFSLIVLDNAVADAGVVEAALSTGRYA
jgi:hypothetical protein